MNYCKHTFTAIIYDTSAIYDRNDTIIVSLNVCSLLTNAINCYQLPDRRDMLTLSYVHMNKRSPPTYPLENTISTYLHIDYKFLLQTNVFPIRVKRLMSNGYQIPIQDVIYTQNNASIIGSTPILYQLK